MLHRIMKYTWTPTTCLKSGVYARAAVALCLIGGTSHAQEDDRIYYGSRVGMHLTTISKKGIGTENAVIFVKHTPKDAKAFCVEYDKDHSMACVKRTMASVKVRDRVSGNCVQRTWADLRGERFAFLGPTNQSEDVMADYLIKDLQSGEILDGSTASGYGVQITIFSQLCPGIVEPQ